MSVDSQHAARDSTSCPAGSVFYSCVANNFRGCCSTDPCALPACPDTAVFVIKNPKDDDDDEEDDSDSTATSTATPRATPTQSGDSKSQGAGTKTTMTDSGITHTIPNNSIVTVTRHTTITTARPTSTTSSTGDSASSSDAITGTVLETSDQTPIPSPSDAGVGGDSSTDSGGGTLASGAIIGIAVGGAVLVAIIAVLAFAFIRRNRKKHQSNADSAFNHDTGRDDLVEEKHFPHPLSTHTTGTQGSSDPFAPFGGRADQPEDPYAPPSGTFEMDGTSAAPVELPAISAPGPAVTSASRTPRLEPVLEIVPTDPRANLNSLRTDSGQPAFVNHWNQYKNLG